MNYLSCSACVFPILGIEAVVKLFHFQMSRAEKKHVEHFVPGQDFYLYACTRGRMSSGPGPWSTSPSSQSSTT
jgi:hypothetical protein